MARIQVTWVVKTKSGQIKGPFSTEAILKMIGEGIISGEEMISKLPHGHWTLISKEPDFYEKLLQAIEGVHTPEQPKSKKVDSETAIIPLKTKEPQKKAEEQTLDFEILKDPQKLIRNPSASVNLEKKIENDRSKQEFKKKKTEDKPLKNKKDKVINLSNAPTFGVMEVLTSLKIPVVILLLAGAVGVALFEEDSTSSGEKIQLISPGKPTSPLSDAQIKSKLNEALLAIEQDTFESYLSAENKLVSLVEGAPTNVEVRALLCMVYRELWPFAQQNAQDIKTIESITQTTRALNIISPMGRVCEFVKLWTSGRYKEARSSVETALEETTPFSMLPVFYEYKAELLQGEKDFLNSVPYFEKSIQLWDKWLHPQVQLAALKLEQQNFSDASRLLQLVLKKNPKHREAKFLLGAVEYQGFKNIESSFSLLTSANELKSLVPSLVESQGLRILAEIYLQKNEKAKALEIAQRAQSLNPNNSELRQLILSLGGKDKTSSSAHRNSEMLFMGEQYVRQGDCLAAQAEFKAAFDLDPKNGVAAMKAAKCLWQLNQSYEAIEWLKKAVKAEPKLIAAYVLQADYMSQRYDFAGATSALLNAGKVSSMSYEVMRGFAWLEFRKNNMIAAINYGLRAAKIYDGDVETYILLSKANSLLSQSIVPSNKKEIDRKDLASRDAVKYATKAIEIDTTNPEAQITYAKVLAVLNGVEAGITYLNELIKRYSFTLDYQLALAEILKDEDRWSQSQKIYEKIVGLDPKNKKAWLGFGEGSRALGLNDKALKAFLQAAILDPTDGEALFQAGKLYLETGKHEDAIQQFRRVQRTNPYFPRTNYYIGRASFASGDYTAAMDAVRAEKKLNPNIADSYILAAEIQYSRRQFQECAGEYSQALKLRTQGADIYVKAAQCYRQSGSIDVAEDMLSLAATRESGYAEIYRELGAIYELKGDARSAATSYNKYIGLSPNAPDRVEIINRINRLSR